MPILSMDELRSMNAEEREAKLAELQVELVRARTMVKAGGAVENPSRIRELRKAIARILTVEGEIKRLEQGGST